MPGTRHPPACRPFVGGFRYELQRVDHRLLGHDRAGSAPATGTRSPRPRAMSASSDADHRPKPPLKRWRSSTKPTACCNRAAVRPRHRAVRQRRAGSAAGRLFQAPQRIPVSACRIPATSSGAPLPEGPSAAFQVPPRTDRAAARAASRHQAQARRPPPASSPARWAHRDRGLALDVETAGAATSSRTMPPGTGCGGVVNGSAWAAGPASRPAVLAGDGKRPVHRDRHNLLACRKIKVVQQQRHARLVAQRGSAAAAVRPPADRARRRRWRRLHRTAAPGHRHQPHLAVEVRQISGNSATPSAPACTSGTNSVTVLCGMSGRAKRLRRAWRYGRLAVGWRDQASPVVADVEAKPAAARNDRTDRVRRSREPQNAFVHRCRLPRRPARCAAGSPPAPRRILLWFRTPSVACAHPDRCRPRPARWRGQGVISHRRRCGTCTVTYAPVPQSADTGTSTSAPPAGTDTLRTRARDRTVPVALPRRRTAGRCGSPLARRVGLAVGGDVDLVRHVGLSEDTQPERNRIDVAAMPPSSNLDAIAAEVSVLAKRNGAPAGSRSRASPAVRRATPSRSARGCRASPAASRAARAPGAAAPSRRRGLHRD